MSSSQRANLLKGIRPVKRMRRSPGDGVGELRVRTLPLTCLSINWDWKAGYGALKFV